MQSQSSALPSMRDFLELLDQHKELRKVSDEVNAKFEISAIHMKVQAEKGPALLFDRVKGFKIPVLVNLLQREGGLRSRWDFPPTSTTRRSTRP